MEREITTPDIANVDPNTGEMLDYEPDLEFLPDDPMDKWGDEAKAMLSAITYESCGRYWRKKRLTLLALADAALLGKPKNTVWQLPDTCTYVSYYRWIAHDPIFTAANDLLIGPVTKGANSSPSRGIVQAHRDVSILEAESIAIDALAEARTMLRIASAEAVATLREALASADIRRHPQWRERIMAATAILDRADADTASRQPAALTQINQAIMMIYQEATGEPPAVVSDSDTIIEGVVTHEQAATGEQHDMHKDRHDAAEPIWTKAEQKRLLDNATVARVSQKNGE